MRREHGIVSLREDLVRRKLGIELRMPVAIPASY